MMMPKPFWPTKVQHRCSAAIVGSTAFSRQGAKEQNTARLFGKTAALPKVLINVIIGCRHF